MPRTIFFFTVFWIFLLISLPLILPVYLLRLLKSGGTRKKYIKLLTSTWARFTLFTAGIRIIRKGTENVPVSGQGFVIVSNHQGNFDIPVLVAALPFSPGFIAKEELSGIPLISNWMKALDCLLINRKNPRDASEKIQRRLKEEGKNPLVLFPEGTRSRSKEMGEFRRGSLKLIFQNKVDILPVTVMGTFKAYEENNNIRPADVYVTLHPLIRTSDYSTQQFPLFLIDLTEKIREGL